MTKGDGRASRLQRWLPYALFLILVLVFLWRPIFTGRALLPGDYLARMQPWTAVESQKSKVESPRPQWNPLEWDAIAQFYPWRVFYARSMRSGHIPLWNPHQFCGTPFLANGQSACLYPPQPDLSHFRPHHGVHDLRGAASVPRAGVHVLADARAWARRSLGGLLRRLCSRSRRSWCCGWSCRRS